MPLSYNEQMDKENILKLRELCKDLPPYCKDFFRGIEPRTESKTRIAYAYDLKVFFSYLLESNPVLAAEYGCIQALPLAVLDRLSGDDIEEYMEYLKYRSEDNKEIFNKERGIKRKIASLKSFYKYFYDKEALENNPLSRVPLPRLKDKEIVRLEIDEVVRFFGRGGKGRQSQ